MKRHYMTNQQKTPQINSLHALAGAPRGKPKEKITKWHLTRKQDITLHFNRGASALRRAEWFFKHTKFQEKSGYCNTTKQTTEHNSTNHSTFRRADGSNTEQRNTEQRISRNITTTPINAHDRKAVRFKKATP